MFPTQHEVLPLTNGKSSKRAIIYLIYLNNVLKVLAAMDVDVAVDMAPVTEDMEDVAEGDRVAIYRRSVR